MPLFFNGTALLFSVKRLFLATERLGRLSDSSKKHISQQLDIFPVRTQLTLTDSERASPQRKQCRTLLHDNLRTFISQPALRSEQ